MTHIVERLRFDAFRCELQFSKGVAMNIEEAAARIEQLEARIEQSLREINEAVLAEREACAAIAAKRPHHSGLEIAELILDQDPPSARQENDDVFKGFRGNNEA